MDFSQPNGCMKLSLYIGNCLLYNFSYGTEQYIHCKLTCGVRERQGQFNHLTTCAICLRKVYAIFGVCMNALYVICVVIWGCIELHSDDVELVFRATMFQ